MWILHLNNLHQNMIANTNHIHLVDFKTWICLVHIFTKFTIIDDKTYSMFFIDSLRDIIHVRFIHKINFYFYLQIIIAYYPLCIQRMFHVFSYNCIHLWRRNLIVHNIKFPIIIQSFTRVDHPFTHFWRWYIYRSRSSAPPQTYNFHIL